MSLYAGRSSNSVDLVAGSGSGIGGGKGSTFYYYDFVILQADWQISGTNYIWTITNSIIKGTTDTMIILNDEENSGITEITTDTQEGYATLMISSDPPAELSGRIYFFDTELMV